MPSKSGNPTNTRRAQLVRNQRFYLRKLLKAGELDKARVYALATGQVFTVADPGGAGVLPEPTPQNLNQSSARPENFPKKDPKKDPEKEPGSDPAPAPDSAPFSVHFSGISETNPDPVLAPVESSYTANGGSYSVSGPGQDPVSVSSPAGSVSFAVVSSKPRVLHEVARDWQKFVARLRLNGASSILSWEEFAELQARLGFAVQLGDVQEKVDVIRTTVREKRVGEDDLPGTVRAKVHQVVPNRAMRLVKLVDGDDKTEKVCWVPRYFHEFEGLEIDMRPNDDERGGYVLVGDYGKRGVRIR